jgi:hypothetical protein
LFLSTLRKLCQLLGTRVDDNTFLRSPPPLDIPDHIQSLYIGQLSDNVWHKYAFCVILKSLCHFRQYLNDCSSIKDHGLHSKSSLALLGIAFLIHCCIIPNLIKQGLNSSSCIDRATLRQSSVAPTASGNVKGSAIVEVKRQVTKWALFPDRSSPNLNSEGGHG